MFSCVWLHFKKFSEKYFLVFGEEEGKDKPDKPRRRRRRRDLDLREIAIDGAVVGQELAKHRAVEPSRASIAILPLVELASRASIVDDFFSGFCPCFSKFVFSFFFSKHQKIFFGKFFEMQPNTWKHFPFLKIAFLENGIFSGNAFTRTKHSLST